jgi:hypothetical protein|tara:strand:+ start:102 stop:1010 length:909 start_codon:yes stop_codon:yes gene_type:complete
MAVTVGQTIGEAEYTTIRGGIVLVMGTPTGTGTGAAGYNESITSSTVSPGDKIAAADWNNLKTDINKAYTHQVGSAPNPALATVNTDSGITKTIHDALETATNFIKNAGNRFTIGSGQSTTVSARSKTKTNWNGTQVHAVNFTWSSSNEVKAFFNAGGKLVFSSSISSGTGAKTDDWRAMCAGPGVVTMNHVSVSKTGATGTVINDGYYDLNSTSRYLVSKTGTNPYSENDYQIEARSITNGVRIRLIYRDDDAGDQTGTGPAVDENVGGTLTSSLSYIRPTGTNVQVSAPTIAVHSSNTFT